jgi:adhesin transport system membrane fusion protein
MSNNSFGQSGFGIATVEDDERRASKILVWATGATLVLALAWASWFQLDEITRGQGKVIPSSREQVIQSLDTGVLSEMYVREGSIVEKNQVLLQIDDARSGAVYREAQEKYVALSALAARLKSEAYGVALVFPEDVRKETGLIQQETQAYNARKRALTESLRSLDISLAAVTRELAMTEPLVKQGVMSEVELLRLRRHGAAC